MGKTNRTKAEIKDRHTFRRKRKEELDNADKQWLKDEISSLRRRDDDQEQGEPIHTEQQVVHRGAKNKRC